MWVVQIRISILKKGVNSNKDLENARCPHHRSTTAQPQIVGVLHPMPFCLGTQWIPARTPTVQWDPNNGEAVGGPHQRPKGEVHMPWRVLKTVQYTSLPKQIMHFDGSNPSRKMMDLISSANDMIFWTELAIILAKSTRTILKVDETLLQLVSPQAFRRPSLCLDRLQLTISHVMLQRVGTSQQEHQLLRTSGLQTVRDANGSFRIKKQQKQLSKERTYRKTKHSFDRKNCR